MIKQRLFPVLVFILNWVSFNLGATNSTTAPSYSNLSVLDRVVASVNSEAITESELNRQTQLLIVRLRQTETSLPPMPVLRQQLLERMIMEKLQLQLAAIEGIKVDEKTLDQALNDIAVRDNLSRHQLQQFLEEQGVPFAHFRDTIKTEITLSRIQQKEIGQQITISKSDIDYFLNSPAGQDESGVEYHLGHILVALPESSSKEQSQKMETRAQSIVKELKEGADFAKTAIAISSDQQALKGGDLGWRKAASIPTSFVKIVPTLQIGEIYGPIRDNSGSHIIKLLDKRNQPVCSETVRSKAMEILYQRKFDELLVPWLRHLRSDAEIEIFLNEK